MVVISPACERITGYSAEELRGRTLADIPYATRESLEIVQPVWERISHGEVVRFDLPGQHRDGRKVIIAATETLLRDAKGKITGMIFIGRDATELREKQKQLGELQRLNEEIVENAPVGIIRMDGEERIVYANPKMAEILGFEGEGQLPTLGQRITDLPSIISTGLPQSARERLYSGRQISEIVPFTSLYGKESVLSVTGVPLLDGAGAFDGTVLLIQDVTEQMKAQEELRSLYQTNIQIMSPFGLQERLDTIAKEAAGLANAHRASILEIDEGGDIVYRATYGHSLEVARQRKYKAGEDYLGQVAREAKLVMVLDAQNNPDVIPEVVKEEGITSFIHVLLKVGEKVFLLFVSNKIAGEFSQRDLSLLRVMVGQAAITVENAWLYEKTRQDLAGLKIIHDLGLKTSSTLELQEILDSIVEGAVNLLGAEKAAILMIEDEEIVYRAAYGFSPASTQMKFKLGEGYIGRVALSGEPAMVLDAPSDSHLSQEVMDRENLRSFIHLPLKVKDKTVGLLNITNKREGSFSSKDLELASILANQAAIAMEHALLFAAEQQRAKEAGALLEMATTVGSSLALKEVLSLVCHATAQLCQMDRCTILLLDEAKKRLIPTMSQLAWGTDQLMWKAFKQMKLEEVDEEPLLQKVIRDREVVISENVRQHPLHIKRWIKPFGVCSLLAVPLITKGEVIGLMLVDNYRRHVHHFTSEQVRMATGLANQAALAIRNAQLYSKAQDLAILEERYRLARDLHDSMSQLLFSLALNSEVAAQDLERNPQRAKAQLLRVRQIAEQARQEMRSLIFELRPLAPEAEGLEDSLKSYMATIEAFERGRIGVRLELEGAQQLPRLMQETLYRLAQEALNNVTRHSQASLVTVKLKRLPGEVALEVRDNGVGFEVARGKGLGLVSMKERADKAGGGLEIYSQPGAGTAITARLPLEQGVPRLNKSL